MVSALLVLAHILAVEIVDDIEAVVVLAAGSEAVAVYVLAAVEHILLVVAAVVAVDSLAVVLALADH